MIQSDWYGLYADGWKNEIVPDAFAHPAKFSRALIRRIYQHVLEEGWISAGDTVLDPFGGVGLGGLDSMRAGLHWVGVELEPRFVELGNQNIELWRALAERAAAWGLNGWGSTTLLQGDSRALASVLGGAGAGLGVSSSPFSQPGEQPCASQSQVIKDYHAFTRGSGTKYDHQMTSPANLGNMREGSHAAAVISSPPFTGDALGHDAGCVRLDDKEDDRREREGTSRRPGYGTTPGQLGAMAVSSPPYAESLASDDPDRRGGLFRDPKRRNDKTLTAEYGTSPGQLGAMAVSSPPWEASLDRGTVNKDERVKLARELGISNAEHVSPIDMERIGKREQEYGDTAGQIGNDTGQDFWQAARAVVEQLRLCLRPGAHAVFVTKRFVRDKQIVNFSQQWADLCASCGFELVHWHKAWLVEDRGSQRTLFGEVETKQVARKSFFRRLYEAKYPENSIDWEDVLCLELVR